MDLFLLAVAACTVALSSCQYLPTIFPPQQSTVFPPPQQNTFPPAQQSPQQGMFQPQQNFNNINNWVPQGNFTTSTPTAMVTLPKQFPLFPQYRSPQDSGFIQYHHPPNYGMDPTSKPPPGTISPAEYDHGVELPTIVNDIIVYPPVLKMGLTSSLKCYVANKGPTFVYWMKTSAMSAISVDDRIVVDEDKRLVDGIDKYVMNHYKEGDKDVFELVINRLQLIDNGNYTCSLYISGGINTRSLPSKTVALVVVVPPRIDTARTLSVYNGALNRSARMECYADGIPMPNITWERMNGARFKDGAQVVRGNILIISPVQRDDVGLYRCAARNAVDPDDPLTAQFDIRFNVLYPPESYALQTYVGQAQNKHYPAYLDCVVGGNPQAELYWMKVRLRNDSSVWSSNFQVDVGSNELLRGSTCDLDWVVERRILQSDIYQITISQHGIEFNINQVFFRLRIDNVRGLDYGDYICVGRNSIGASCSHVVLYETADCQTKECPDLSRQYAPQGVANKVTSLHSSHFRQLSFLLVASFLKFYLF